MDIDALHSALLSITIVSEKLRASREIIEKVEEVVPGFGELLDEADKDLTMAKATLAGELGFNVCPRCWPPELLTTDRKGRVRCPTCGEISFKQARDQKMTKSESSNDEVMPFNRGLRR